jgi:PAS domain S-box-containing protein
MKGNIWTPMADRDKSRNAFESEKPGTNARTLAEGAIEDVRRVGGVFVLAVRATRMAMAVTDPTLPGNPIVFANQSILKLSGYSMNEVLGQQPHFMNGRDTDPNDAARIAEALRNDQDDVIETVQYRKDRSRFVATVLISAFKDERGETANHFLSWLDVTRRVDAEEEIASLRLVQAQLRESEERQAFLLKLSDALRTIIDASEIQSTTARLVGKYLAVDRAMYAEVAGVRGAETGTIHGQYVRTDASGAPVLPFPRHFNFADFGSEIMAQRYQGDALVVSDLRIAPNYDPKERDAWQKQDVRAAIVMPLVKAGHLVAEFGVHSAIPRNWTTAEVTLIAEAAERTWAAAERARAEHALRDGERQALLLLAELQHRVRNTLAVVRSIARRTADNSDSVETMLGHFQGRLDAFSRVQAALTRSPAALIDLKSLIEDEMVAHAAREGEQVSIEGPDIELVPKTAERLSLAIHELTTNAVKHGAFVHGNGKVRIRWSIEKREGGDALMLRWKETGVRVDPGTERRQGFGMELLQRSLPYDLQAETSVDFQPDGLEFRMSMPLRARPSVN